MVECAMAVESTVDEMLILEKTAAVEICCEMLAGSRMVSSSSLWTLLLTALLPALLSLAPVLYGLCLNVVVVCCCDSVRVVRVERGKHPQPRD